MDRDDAGRQIPHVDVAETGGFHHRLERRLVGVLPDRFGEVAIAAFVVRDQLADARQHLERMEVVKGPQPVLVDARELQDQCTPAGLQHALHFRKCLGLVGDIAQTEGDRDRIEGSLRKRQCLGVHLRPAQAPQQASIQQAIAPGAQHRGIDVGNHDFAGVAHARQQQRGDVTGAARKVQHAIALANPRSRDEESLPQTMDAERHQVVHHVVLAGDRREHFADQSLLVGHRHFAVTEVGGRGWMRFGHDCIVR